VAFVIVANHDLPGLAADLTVLDIILLGSASRIERDLD
jgi:hypothetical protein